MFALPVIVLLFIAIFTTWCKSVVEGYYAKRVPDPSRYFWSFGLIQSAACGCMIAVILAVSGGIGTFSPRSVLLGVALGILNVVGLVSGIAAYGCGPFSYTTVLRSMSTLISALSGFLFGEGLPSALQYVGVILMVVCLLLAPEQKGDEKKASFRWLLLCGASAVASGLTGVCQKIHQHETSPVRDEMGALLLSAFAVSVIFFAVMTAVNLGKEKRVTRNPTDKKRNGLVFVMAILSGVVFAFCHTVNLNLAGRLPAIIMFPVVNLVPMILVMVTGVLLFRERLSRRRWIGMGVGVAAIVLLSGVLG